jgi:hypothetical protein
LAKKNKLPKSIYFFGLAGAILIAMFFTLSQNGHSYESTYELGVPDLLSVTSNQEITQIKCFLKQSTKVYDVNNNQVGDLLQSRFSPTMNPTLEFYSPDNTERGNALAGFNIEPKIRCLNMSLDENDQRKDQFEIAPSTLTLRYYATDNQGNWKLLESKTQKTGAFGSDKTSGNYVQLQYGSESKLGMFSIPIAPLEKKLPEGNYPSTQKFTIEGDIKINWQGYRNQQYTLEVEQDDIKTVSQVQVISNGGDPPNQAEQIKTCVSIEGGDYRNYNGQVACVCKDGYNQIQQNGKSINTDIIPINSDMVCKEKEIRETEYCITESYAGQREIMSNNSNECKVEKQSCDGDWLVFSGNMESIGLKTGDKLYYCEYTSPPPPCNPPKEIVNGECVIPPEPPTECDDWLTCSIDEIKDCAEKDNATDLALCLIKVEAFYLTGVGILAIGIAGKIFNRRSSGYYGV